MKITKTNPYLDTSSFSQDKAINLSSDIPMQVFEMLKIALDIGLKTDEESDTKSKDVD